MMNNDFRNWHKNNDKPQAAEMPTPSFPTDLASIWARVQSIDPVKYAKSRNFLTGAVTYLSPYISRGVISTRQVYEAMLAKGYTLWQMEKFVSELAWRDYFQQVYKSIGERMFTDIKQPQPDVMHHQMPLAVANGTTGIESIDQGIQRLKETGYMHNHLRMYTASIACNVGKAHWTKPAAWMYYHLLDGDLASNTCSWQWVAGSFSSKKYYCNQENINKYAGSTQRQTFLDHPYEVLPASQVPIELKATDHIQLATQLPATGEIRVSGQKPILLYNHYNLDPTWRSEEDADRILLLEPSHFEKFPVSPQVIQFVLALTKNISGLQLYVGELADLCKQLGMSEMDASKLVIHKEHPAFMHYPGRRESRTWLAPAVQGYFPSFFAFWKKASRHL
jgi:deoxyribodipyrimidine photo-lyase